ncbi:MAG: hypothetical protein AB1896_04020 [Thermodesulfobacteriota bacterium]
MKRKNALVILSVLVVLAWAAGALAQDAAMVVEMKGDPAVYESAAKKGQEVMLMDFLAEGDVIKLGPNTSLVLNYFASGAREEITGPGVITVGQQSSEKQGEAEIKTAKVDYIPEPTAGQGQEGALHVGTVALRGTSPASPELLPLGPSETAVRSLPLTFRWRPVSGAESYKFALRDKDGHVLVKGETKTPAYECDQADLARNQEYWWTVEAIEMEDVIAEGGGKFFLLGEKDLNQIALTEMYIQKHYEEGSAEAQIATAMLYKKYQLNEEAREVLMDLKKKHPRNANLDRQLNELNTNYTPRS